MEKQSDKLGKLALCVSSCGLAKEVLVKQNGIGEDLPFTVFGWRNDELAIVAQLDPAYMELEPEQRLAHVNFCAHVLRKGWHVTGITFMAEAYCSSNPEETLGKELRALFAQQDSPVDECLTFTHVEGNQVALVVAPYRQVVGRKVEWFETFFQKEASGLRDSAYPALLLEVLAQDVHELPEDTNEFYETLIDGLNNYGFVVQTGF